MDSRILIAAACIICIIIIYYLQSAATSFDKYLSGIWVMDEHAAAESEVTNMMLYFGDPSSGIFRTSITGYAVVNSGAEILDDGFTFTYWRPLVPLIGRIKISAAMNDNSVFGKKVTMEFDIAQGFLKIYDRETNYGLFWKQTGITN